MSQVKDNFLAAVRVRNWRDAYLNCNGLNMFEMLRGLEEIGPSSMFELRQQGDGFANLINLPRIRYAMDVVQFRRLPAVAPGDLVATGQVEDARGFLASGIPSEKDRLVQELINDLDTGRLNGAANRVDLQIRALANGGHFNDGGGRHLTASVELLRMLVGLGEQNQITLLSLFRFGQGPHGEVQPDGSAIGRAADISMYAGSNINLLTPANAPTAIRGVAAVIQSLPIGRYTLGLPRPGGGALIDAAHDVFLPVTDHAQVDRSPTGTFAGDMGRVLQPARDALQQAANNNGRAQISFMFPDGVDHLHVKALP